MEDNNIWKKLGSLIFKLVGAAAIGWVSFWAGLYILLLLPSTGLHIVQVIIAMAISIVVSVTQNSKEMLYSGVCINLSMTDEGSAYVTDGWFAKLEGNQKTQQTELIPMALNSGANALTDIEMSGSEKLIAMITSGELDYMLMDASSLTYAGNNGMVAPLDEFLSQEMIAKFEGKIVTLQVDGKNYLAAIDISDLPFVKKHMGSTNKVYIGFPGNTSRSERNEAFLQYLMDWTE